MTIQTALAITQPHRAAELERARQQRAEDEEWCRWRRKYPKPQTLARAKAEIRDAAKAMDGISTKDAGPSPGTQNT